MTNPSESARALQRLSAKTRWAKLSPEARAEIMRTVRHVGMEGKEFDLLLTQPKKQSASAMKRAPKPKRNTMNKTFLLLAAICGTIQSLGADTFARDDELARQREMMRQTAVMEDQAWQMQKQTDLLIDALRTPEERARIAEEQKRIAEREKLEAAQVAKNRAIRAKYGLGSLPPGYDERYKVTERQLPAMQAAQRAEAQRRAERIAKDAPKREAWLAERAARKAEAAKLP